MAKRIRVSNDGGTTWTTLPGSGGSVSVDGETIDDTILGQTFQSGDVGLLGWNISSDGIFKGFPGYGSSILIGGTPVTATGEAMTQESGQIYAINTAAREIWDRTATITVYDGASDETAEVEWIDYLFGRVKFVDTYTVLGSITVDVDYIPTAVVARPNNYTLTMTAEAIDESDFPAVQANSGYRVYASGLRTVALELGGIFDSNEGLKADLVARNEVIMEIDPAGDGSSIARGFFKLTTAGQSGDVGAVEDENATFTLVVPDESLLYIPFNWRHTATTLNQGIQDAIESWVQELNTYDVQYLPTGVEGASPLEGIEGNFVATDISLSGGLNTMNVFTMEFQGTGAYTLV